MISNTCKRFLKLSPQFFLLHFCKSSLAKNALSSGRFLEMCSNSHFVSLVSSESGWLAPLSQSKNLMSRAVLKAEPAPVGAVEGCLSPSFSQSAPVRILITYSCPQSPIHWQTTRTCFFKLSGFGKTSPSET